MHGRNCPITIRALRLRVAKPSSIPSPLISPALQGSTMTRPKEVLWRAAFRLFREHAAHVTTRPTSAIIPLQHHWTSVRAIQVLWREGFPSVGVKSANCRPPPHL